jgi:5-formyltetrahydrofolate cyclo-ligase
MKKLLTPIVLLAFTTKPVLAFAPSAQALASSSTPNHRTRPSSSLSQFDETAYETDRLAKDAAAMDAMKREAESEYAKLRTPWKWRIRKAVWDYLEEKNIAQFPRCVHVGFDEVH